MGTGDRAEEGVKGTRQDMEATRKTRTIKEKDKRVTEKTTNRAITTGILNTQLQEAHKKEEENKGQKQWKINQQKKQSK